MSSPAVIEPMKIDSKVQNESPLEINEISSPLIEKAKDMMPNFTLNP